MGREQRYRVVWKRRNSKTGDLLLLMLLGYELLLWLRRILSLRSGLLVTILLLLLLLLRLILDPIILDRLRL